jgi:hypothetical protein
VRKKVIRQTKNKNDKYVNASGGQCGKHTKAHVRFLKKDGECKKKPKRW